MNTFVVIEDDFENYLTLVDLLEGAFPGSSVLPEYHSDSTAVVFNDWGTVFSLLQNVAAIDAIICIDLSLRDSDNQDVIRGVEKVKLIRAMSHKLKRDWTFIAYTRNSIRAGLVSDFSDTFHGVIEKGRLDPLPHVSRVSYVREIVRAAIRKQRAAVTDPLSGVHIIDSLGMRLFRAAFGDALLAELIEKEAPGWTAVSVESVSSGHSGAFMLVVRGNSNGHQSLVIKLAKDERIIDHEVRAVSEHLASLGPLNGELCAVDGKGKQSLISEPAFYYRQAEVDGMSLLAALREGVATGTTALEHVIRVCIDVCDSAALDQSGGTIASRAFPLTAIDLGRLSGSIAFQRDLGAALARRNFVPDLPIERWCNDILQVAAKWTEWPVAQVELPVVVQHGDLNPANVIVRKRASPVLIDFARLKAWPVGYDLSRLSLMLRLRLLGCESSAAEWFPAEIATWLQVGVAMADAHTQRLCPPAASCDRAFDEFLSRHDIELTKKLRLGYRLATLWDLLKVISYQDVSPYKRFWALCKAGELLDALAT